MKINLKFFFVLFVLMVLSVLVNAQTEKGNFLIAGSTDLDFAVYSVKLEESNFIDDNAKFSAIGITSGAGYFIADNLVMGLLFSLSYTKEIENEDESSELTRLFLPFARLYIGKKNIKPFLQAAYGMGLNRTTDYFTEEEYITGYEVDGGLAVFFNRNISLDIALGYASLIAENNNWKSTGRGIGGKIGVSILF